MATSRNSDQNPRNADENLDKVTPLHSVFQPPKRSPSPEVTSNPNVAKAAICHGNERWRNAESPGACLAWRRHACLTGQSRSEKADRFSDCQSPTLAHISFPLPEQDYLRRRKPSFASLRGIHFLCLIRRGSVSAPPVAARDKRKRARQPCTNPQLFRQMWRSPDMPLSLAPRCGQAMGSEA